MPTTQTTDSVQDAREALLATLDLVEPIVTMSHEDLVVIALGSKVGGWRMYLPVRSAGMLTGTIKALAPYLSQDYRLPTVDQVDLDMASRSRSVSKSIP